MTSNPYRDGAPCPTSVRRGDIFYADLSPVIGSEQGGLRPVLIIQNDIGNRYSPTVIAAAITSRLGKAKLPTHIDLFADRVGLVKDSVILMEQIRTLDKRRLREKIGHLDSASMEDVNNAIAVSFGLQEGDRERATRRKARVPLHEPMGDPHIARRPVHAPQRHPIPWPLEADPGAVASTAPAAGRGVESSQAT